MVLRGFPLGLLLAAAAAPLAPVASAASILGRVEVLRELPPLSPRPRVAALGMHPPVEATDRRRAVVYLEEAPRRAFDEPDGVHAVLDQRNQAFIPSVLAITAGTTVDFLNSDGMYHNVFSLSKPKRFDLGRYPRGQKKSVRFDRPGVVRVFCDIHSHMSAFILVFAHRYFAVTQHDGSYRIDGIPAGTYTVVAWHEGEARVTRTVQVPASGAVEQDFQIR